MNFDLIYKEAIDKRFEELMVKKVITTIKGVDIFESNDEHHSRIKALYWNLLKVNGKDTVYAFFLSTLQNIIDKGSIPSELIFDYALEQFKERQYPRREVWPELNDWFKLNKEEVEKLYVEYKACDKALDVLYYGTNINSFGSVDETHEVEQIGNKNKNKNKEEVEASYMSILNKNKSKIIDELYDFLNGYYIDDIDKEVFIGHFNGKLQVEKINFKKDLYLLIRLLDGLVDLFELGFVSRVFKTSRYESVITHFVYKGQGIQKTTWEKTRSRYKDYYANDDKKIFKIEKFIKNLMDRYCPS